MDPILGMLLGYWERGFGNKCKQHRFSRKRICPEAWPVFTNTSGTFSTVTGMDPRPSFLESTCLITLGKKRTVPRTSLQNLESHRKCLLNI